jgi:hypothetical protein
MAPWGAETSADYPSAMESSHEQADSLSDLHGAASHSMSVLRRFSGEGSVLEQIANGDWDEELRPDDARDLSDLLDAMRENVRHAREMAGLLRDSNPPFQGATGFQSLLETHLPLNRKERYYTGTVLPMLVAGDGFAHLTRFLTLCGLHVETAVANALDGGQHLQFFTEYSFLESCFTDRDRARLPHAPTEGDTPDVIIAGDDWLLAVEAKMYHNPSAEALDTQMRRQRVIVDYLREQLHIPTDRVAHVLLLPSAFRPGELASPVVTWEAVLDDYRVVGPAYWAGVLEIALARYEELVSRGPAFGTNADGKMLGSEIVDAHAHGTLKFTFMGRQDGITGKSIQADIESGKWRTHQYEIRYSPLSAKNWFPIKEFIARTSSDPALGPGGGSTEQTE